MKDFEDIEDGYGAMGMLFAFLGGALAGATTALLLTPKTGLETRQQLRDFAYSAKDKVSRAPRRIREAGEQARERISGAYETGARSHTRH